MIVAILADAERWADDVAGLLAAWATTAPGWPGRPLTAALLYKVGALARLRRLERAGLTPHLPASLPPSEAVLADLPATDTPAERYPSDRLARQLLGVRLFLMVWEPLQGTADVVLGRNGRDDLVDAMADFLWQFRHLAVQKKE